MIAAAFLSSAITVDNKLSIGENAPKIELTQGNNVVVDATSQNKTKIVNFWNPKKPASRILNSQLNRKYSSEENANVEFISICTDSDETLMKEVMKMDGVDTSRNFSYSQVSKRTLKDFNAESSPKAYKISPDGKIMEIF